MKYLPPVVRPCLRFVFAGWAILTSLAVPAAFAVPSSFQNGSFENNAGDGTSVVDGWYFSGSGANVVSNSEGATDGSFSVVFNQGMTAPDGLLAQTFKTIAGQTYTVRFDFGSSNLGNATSSELQVEVRDGPAATAGTQIIDFASGSSDELSGGVIVESGRTLRVRDQSGAAAPNPIFSTVSFTFTALSSVSTIVFTDQSSGGASAQDAALDNVRLDSKVSFTTLFSFTGPTGDNPGSQPYYGSLIKGRDGFYYGATSAGGSRNAGVVFKMNARGVQTSVADFSTVTGASPYTGVVEGGDGSLYGTTNSGGAENLGSIYKITPDGVQTTLVNLTSAIGTYPYGCLELATDGNFYGAATYGGSDGVGTLFKVTPAGAFTVLVNCQSGTGAYPVGGLTQGSDGDFYGTTYSGGTGGNGTVFKVTAEGAYTVLWNFSNDGSQIYSKLIEGRDGSFYGTAVIGGANGGGTIFKITPAGALTVLVNLSSETTGAYPYAGLVQGTDGYFYGATSSGGPDDAQGTLFRMSAEGELTTLVKFSSNQAIYGSLIQGGSGEFYGMSSAGGTSNSGTVFKLSLANVRVSLPTMTGGELDRAGETGSGLPAGATWRSFGIPGLDSGAGGLSDGAPVFRGFFTSPAEGLREGVFGLGGSTPLIAKTGDVAPETDGAVFASLADPVGNGGTAFIGKLARGPQATPATAQGIWSNVATGQAGVLRLVGRQGSPVPGVAGASWKSFTGIALNDHGALIWTADLAGVPAAQSKAVFAQSSFAAGPEVLLRSGQVIPDVGTVKSFLHPSLRKLTAASGGYGTGRANGGAMTPVLLTLDGARKAVATLAPGQAPSIKAITGAAVPPSTGIPDALWSSFNTPSAGGEADLGFVAVLRNANGATGVTKKNNIGLFVLPAGGQLELLSRSGAEAADLPGIHYVNFTDPVLNGEGDVSYFATLADAAGRSAGTGLFWRPRGTADSKLVVRTGDDAPGTDGARISKFIGAALPSFAGGSALAGPIFSGVLTNKANSRGVTAANNVGLWAVDGTGQLRLLARTGSQFEGKTVKTIDAFSYVLHSINQARATAAGTGVIFRATFTDRKTSALVKVAIP